MTAGATPYHFEAHEEYVAITLLPALNDAPWIDIDKVGGELLEQLKFHNHPSFLVDLSPLDYIGSSMVALVVRLWKSVDTEERQMVVVNTSSMVDEVLTLAGLKKIWKIVDSRAQALDALGVSQEAKVEKREAHFVAVIGPVALAAAVIGLVYTLWPINGLPSQASLTVTIGFSAVGLLLGGIEAVRKRGSRRVLGVFVMLVGLALGTTAVLHAVGVLSLS